jgi:hypothetical protein
MTVAIPPADDGRRPDSPARRVDATCDALEAAWRAGRGPRIEDYLAEAEAAVAYNRAARLLFGDFARPNEIHSAEAPPPARRLLIEREVERRLARGGRAA